jgi:putative transposase
MTTPPRAALYKGHRFPAEIISHAVWLYFRFSLSYRDVEEMLAERGVILTYETVRQWCLKFGQTFANELRRQRPRPGDKWHLDEVVLKINGRTHYLWRAVDQHGVVLDILVQSRRDKVAAKKFFRKLHQPTRQRERAMRRFKSAGQAQRFLSAFGPILGHFRPRRHRFSAAGYRAERQRRFLVWSEVTGQPMAA